jgi:hypothetical protein
MCLEYLVGCRGRRQCRCTRTERIESQAQDSLMKKKREGERERDEKEQRKSRNLHDSKADKCYC